MKNKKTGGAETTCKTEAGIEQQATVVKQKCARFEFTPFAEKMSASVGKPSTAAVSGEHSSTTAVSGKPLYQQSGRLRRNSRGPKVAKADDCAPPSHSVPVNLVPKLACTKHCLEVMVEAIESVSANDPESPSLVNSNFSGPIDSTGYYRNTTVVSPLVAITDSSKMSGGQNQSNNRLSVHPKKANVELDKLIRPNDDSPSSVIQMNRQRPNSPLSSDQNKKTPRIPMSVAAEKQTIHIQLDSSQRTVNDAEPNQNLRRIYNQITDKLWPKDFEQYLPSIRRFYWQTSITSTLSQRSTDDQHSLF